MGRGARRAAALLAALALAACAAEAPETAPTRIPPATAESLAARLPAQAAGFERGATATLAQPRAGREVSYATAGRRAAAFVQVLDTASPLADGPGALEVAAEFTRWRDEATQGAGPHRRLSVVREHEVARLFRCADLEGRYGRQPVTSTVCAGAAGGQMLRLRVSQPRRDPPAADPRAFAEAIAEALRGR